MWYKSQNGDANKPQAVDESSSKKVVYVRKDFEQIEVSDGEDGTKTVWTWLETKVPKNDWEAFRMAWKNASDISDLTDALVELAEILTGEE